MPKYNPRVTVLGADLCRVFDVITAHVAARMAAQGLIATHTVHPSRGITCVTRVDKLADNTARPGSYGIQRQALETGHWVYRHHETWDRTVK